MKVILPFVSQKLFMNVFIPPRGPSILLYIEVCHAFHARQVKWFKNTTPGKNYKVKQREKRPYILFNTKLILRYPGISFHEFKIQGFSTISSIVAFSHFHSNNF